MRASPARAPGGEPEIGQAPGDLATLQAFVNTLDIERSADEFSTPSGLDRWLREARLVAEAGGPARPRDLATAVELREALRGVLRSHVSHLASSAADGDPAAGAVPAAASADPAERLADIAAALQARLQADAEGRIVVVPTGSGVAAALTRLLIIAAEAATRDTWTRLKVCSADDCQWAFYDRSPTRSGCWCTMQICGSRAKSRAYRSRAARTA